MVTWPENALKCMKMGENGLRMGRNGPSQMNSKTSELLRSASEQQSGWAEGLEAHQKHSEAIEAALWRHAEQQQVMQSKAGA